MLTIENKRVDDRELEQAVRSRRLPGTGAGKNQIEYGYLATTPGEKNGLLILRRAIRKGGEGRKKHRARRHATPAKNRGAIGIALPSARRLVSVGSADEDLCTLGRR